MRGRLYYALARACLGDDSKDWGTIFRHSMLALTNWPPVLPGLLLVVAAAVAPPSVKRWSRRIAGAAPTRLEQLGSVHWAEWPS
jgi:hypothetical protein